MNEVITGCLYILVGLFQVVNAVCDGLWEKKKLKLTFPTSVGFRAFLLMGILMFVQGILLLF